MKGHGFPWPDMLDCDKFPLDNDMCITSQAESEKGRKEKEAKKNAATGAAKSGLAGASGRGEFLFLIDFYQCQYREQFHC